MADTSVAAEARRRRKEEGRLRKRQRIEEAGGTRPRSNDNNNSTSSNDNRGKKKIKSSSTTTANNNSYSNEPKKQKKAFLSEKVFVSSEESSKKNNNNRKQQQHRFGRVMDQVPCRNKARFSTVSIALPGSVLSNCQTRELRTYLVGQIARAATIYHIDEIIIYDDHLGNNNRKNHNNNYYGRRNKNYHKDGEGRDDKNNNNEDKHNDNNDNNENDNSNHNNNASKGNYYNNYFARILQYCECPQYLRRSFFPKDHALQFAGLLSPIDAPHHVRAEDQCKYREGVVLKDHSQKSSNDSEYSSLVNCGIKNCLVEIDRTLTVGIRCTVQLDQEQYDHSLGKSKRRIKGKVVSPSTPREENGTYWGYTTRLAPSIHDAMNECPFSGEEYDLKIGTSERGDDILDRCITSNNKNNKKSSNNNSYGFNLPSYKHALIVFGGVAGIEECIDADETTTLPGSQSHKLFDLWMNICPFQASRTIRTEEAVMITLAKLSPFLMANPESNEGGVDKFKKDDSPLSTEESSSSSEESTDDSNDHDDHDDNEEDNIDDDKNDSSNKKGLSVGPAGTTTAAVKNTSNDTVEKIKTENSPLSTEESSSEESADSTDDDDDDDNGDGEDDDENKKDDENENDDDSNDDESDDDSSDDDSSGNDDSTTSSSSK